MSTFNGIVPEFPHIRIDNFTPSPPGSPAPPPLATFLSHIHTDHLRGLLSHKSPFIYCSHATRQLLLRIEKYPHRLNFARGVLESRVQTYRHLRTLLRPLPLGTPTEIELRPGEVIRVTLLDANHCPGAVMFLIEGQGRAVLYTGDVRSEPWWIAGLAREPSVVPYVSGLKRLDCVYLDTSFGTREAPYREFEGKRDGIAELLGKVDGYPEDTVFYFNSWTFGYEEVLVALAAFLGSRVHLDEYRWKIYRSLAEGEGRDVRESAPLVGFQEGHRWQPGCFTRDDGKEVRIHSCEKGMGCEVIKDMNVVQITPIVTRYNGVEYMEEGAGGGHGDLDQIHELELTDIATLGSLIDICTKRLNHNPEALSKVTAWLEISVQRGAQNVRLDTQAFYEAAYGDSQCKDLDEIPIDRLIQALEALTKDKTVELKQQPARRITFPYSRHASYNELRGLMEIFRPKSVYPNTYEPGMDMDDLFGDLLEIPTKKNTEMVEDRIFTQTAAVNTTLAPADVPIERSTAPAKLPSKTAIISPPKKKSRSEGTKSSASSSAASAPGKRSRNARDEAQESIKRRLAAYRAALGVDSGGWAANMELISVTGYHNAEPEVEL